MASKSLWRAEAPSNIALIKYMGKGDGPVNIPTNASLSYTLDHLITVVEIAESSGPNDQWAPLHGDGLEELMLSENGQSRFLNHFRLLKEELHIGGSYLLRSANNFPADCGIASSASSFAALTLAAHKLALDNSTDRAAAESLTREQLSALSRKGSGSSCRSFFSPWALWRSEGAEAIKTPYDFLFHQVILLTAQKKSVASSEAHKNVRSSELFSGRPQRAEKRLTELLEALNLSDWSRVKELVWADFWDMHALFETSSPSFGYMTSASLKVLEFCRELWRDLGDGPIVTMDAGANVHLLYRPDQAKLARRVGDELGSLGQVISSPALYGEPGR